MGNDIKFLAKLIVQDGKDEPNESLGLKYLIQVDVGEGRFFIDATNLILRAGVNQLPIKGEHWLDENDGLNHLTP